MNSLQQKVSQNTEIRHEEGNVMLFLCRAVRG